QERELRDRRERLTPFEAREERRARIDAHAAADLHVDAVFLRRVGGFVCAARTEATLKVDDLRRVDPASGESADRVAIRGGQLSLLGSRTVGAVDFDARSVSRIGPVLWEDRTVL